MGQQQCRIPHGSMIQAGGPKKHVGGTMTSTQVLIVGAGPVGLTLALDLGRRGVQCLLVERNATAILLPKMERCNARTMEIFRRLGIAEQVRQAGLPEDAPMDVFLALSMMEPPLVHLPYPSVAVAKAEIAGNNDGRPLEPYQLISQYTLEPLLRSIVETLPNVEVRFSCELLSFVQDESHVTATIREPNGTTAILEAAYMVGCDGGASVVRRQLGIRLAGEGNIRKLRQAHFHCPALYESATVGKGRHYHIAAGPLFPFLILQDSTRHWSLHAAAATDAEMAAIFRGAIGRDIPFEMLSGNEWTQHLLCAERYGDGRVFLAGDSAHLVIPTGGLGMNTGIGDATDLAWKLAGTLHGWGGPALLASYELERRQVGLRNVAAAGAAMSGRLGWRAAWQPDIREISGQATRSEICRRFDTEQRKITEISGIECGYRYVGSPVIAPEPREGPDPDNPRYVPTTWPGVRLPHVWLSDGATLHDRLGAGFTLLRLGGTHADSTELENAIHHTGAPLDVLDVPDPLARDLYERDLVLVRPDLHVVWRGNQAPHQPGEIAALVTGHSP
jgi:2-polyprenyl-6-methoxyphenol hydroxylase-like FAD-dependent oxidoreductase